MKNHPLYVQRKSLFGYKRLVVGPSPRKEEIVEVDYSECP